MQPANFEEALETIVQKDPRFQRDGYLFVREALDFTQKTAAKARTEGMRHVTGQQLLEGIRLYALEVFGPMTLFIFQEWGIRSCEDFGEMVFNLVEHGVLKKTDKDSRDDFKNGYDFVATFGHPFRPETKNSVPSAPSSSSPAGPSVIP